MKEQVDKAVEVLKQGGIILYPTDTVWGIGCDATNKEAVAKIYELKKSESKKAMIVLCHSGYGGSLYKDPTHRIGVDGADRYAPHGDYARWAGVAENLIPEEGSLAIRIADHEFCRNLTRRLGRPLVSTSANISGEPTPSTFGEIARVIIDGVDMVIDLDSRVRQRKPSSIIMFDENETFKIIR